MLLFPENKHLVSIINIRINQMLTFMKWWYYKQNLKFTKLKQRKWRITLSMGDLTQWVIYIVNKKTGPHKYQSIKSEHCENWVG